MYSRDKVTQKIFAKSQEVFVTEFFFSKKNPLISSNGYEISDQLF